MSAVDGLLHGATPPRALWEKSEAAFMAGSVVSEAFSIRADDGDYETVVGWDPSDRGSAIWTDGELEIRPLEGHEPPSVVLVRRGNGRKVLGFNMHGQTYVSPSLRGNGYGTALVMAMSVHTGGLPFEDAEMGFSPAGYAAHAAANREAREWAKDAGLLPRRDRMSAPNPIREQAAV